MQSWKRLLSSTVDDHLEQQPPMFTAAPGDPAEAWPRSGNLKTLKLRYLAKQVPRAMLASAMRW